MQINGILLITTEIFFDMLKEHVEKLGFIPKDNTRDVFYKKYDSFGYVIEVDFEKERINFGKKILCESKTTQNFSQSENWVVLECVNRLLEKGYKPEDIVLEKVYPSGHGHSGRLDVLVKRDGKAFLMIECKTWGREFDKELKNIHKNGGQLLTYFQNDKNTDYLMLYASTVQGGVVDFKNEIIKIEDHYRGAGNVEDVFDRWNKITNQNGIFEDWVQPYTFESKLLIKKELKPLSESDSSFIFHEFLSILRKHSVSDKPNAFNKIFNLFLAKIYDEKKRDNDELDFQWKERDDNPVKFQIRLLSLYKSGMYEFLKKEIEGISDSDFQYTSEEELQEKKKKWLKFNNVFAIKEVIDDESFDDNHRVLKEVVQLLQKYQIRYPRKQQHLSDFFERLLTTGLKQESGQFFSPPPITRFIVKSLPIKEEIYKTLQNETAELPAAIDYAVGSGHFITEMMEEYQNIIDKIDTDNLYPDTQLQVDVWQRKKYDWAKKYIYGIEKDYRLVKVAKVGCYFYGDGLAQVIHGDGLDSFSKSSSYVGLLKDNARDPKFSFVISNPPYSVSSFKGDIKNVEVDQTFELFKFLTDKSSEIECLFVERTKQLLKTGGIAGIILPSSILTNAGLYTKTREILLKSFDIVAIVELGSNTFMATGTNTVTLFLRRRDDSITEKVLDSVNKIFDTLQDITVNGIQKGVTEYVSHVWDGLTLKDYFSILKRKPNVEAEKHHLLVEAKKKFGIKDENVFWDSFIEREKEKMLFFLLSYKQKVVLVKTGDKKKEKQFLGYEFSNRRGSEGMHPIQRGKTIEECTSLFDSEVHDNPKKASTYIYKAFLNDFELSVDEELKNNVSRHDLVDMMTFDRVEFEKNISTSVKKKVKIDTKWNVAKLKEGLVDILDSQRVPVSKNERIAGSYPYYGATGIIDYIDKFIFDERLVLIGEDGAKWGENEKSAFIIEGKTWVNNHAHVLRPNRKKILDRYLVEILNRLDLSSYITGLNVPKLNQGNLKEIKIPLPPLDIQERVVKDLESIDKKEKESLKKLEELQMGIQNLFQDAFSNSDTVYRLSDGSVFDISIGKRVLRNELSDHGKIPVYSANVFEPFGFTDSFLLENFSSPSVLWGIDGDWMVNYIEKGVPFYPTDHCGVLRVKEGKVNEKYLAYVLHREGENLGFSRSKRASIDRIKDIKIQAPSFHEQEKIVDKVVNMQNQADKQKQQISEFSKQKTSILRKYL